MNIPYVFKRCTKCERWLVASKINFHKDKNKKYGIQGQCKECQKAYCKANKERITKRKKQYDEVNKERIAEQKRQYYERNKDAVKERSKKQREMNKEAVSKYMKKYYETNKEILAEQKRQYRQSPKGQIVAFNGHNKRRTKEQSQGNGITKEQWLEMMRFFDWRCAYSGEKLDKDTRSLDHIEPLNKYGVNEIWNAVPMYRPYNSSKRDKDLLDWYTKQEFFSEERLNKIKDWQEYAYNKWGK